MLVQIYCNHFSNLKFDRILFQDFTCSSMCLSEQCWTTYLGFNVIPLLIVVGLVLYIDIFECTYTVNKKQFKKLKLTTIT
jgi:hypothetical protein